MEYLSAAYVITAGALSKAVTDSAICAALTKKHARTFAAASRFLSPEKRRAAFAVYAFCRVADDIADASERNFGQATLALDAHAKALVLACDARPASTAFRELAWAIARFNIPHAPFSALIEMLRNDLAPFEYRNWQQLEAYCGGVASTVGEMCAHVFGLPTVETHRQAALRDARTLGVALQLTNILRDVGEDAERHRCYLPTDDLERFGVTRSEILGRSISPADERWRALMQFEIARTRALYRQAEAGLNALDADAQCCARVCAWGYAEILGAIERRDYDTLGGRSRVGASRKLHIMLRAWNATRTGNLADRFGLRGLLAKRQFSA